MRGEVSRDDAFISDNPDSICGIVDFGVEPSEPGMAKHFYVKFSQKLLFCFSETFLENIPLCLFYTQLCHEQTVVSSNFISGKV